TFPEPSGSGPDAVVHGPDSYVCLGFVTFNHGGEAGDVVVGDNLVGAEHLPGVVDNAGPPRSRFFGSQPHHRILGVEVLEQVPPLGVGGIDIGVDEIDDLQAIAPRARLVQGCGHIGSSSRWLSSGSTGSLRRLITLEQARPSPNVGASGPAQPLR